MNSGRTSLLPLETGEVLASNYRVKSDTGKIIDIRTATNAFDYQPAPDAGRIRRTYTNNYKSLDQFDALWYEIAYYKRDVHWETVFIWAMVLDSIINGRAMYCEAKGLKLRIGPCVKMTNLVKKTNLPKKLKLLFKRVKKGSSTFAIHYLR